MDKNRPYRIVKRTGPESVETLRTGTGNTLTVLTELRSTVFDLANSGKYGTYPDDIESFNEDVEEGFSDTGMSWEAKNGVIVEAFID